MTPETKIISTIISSRDSFVKLLPIVKEDTFSSFGLQVYKEVVDYYEADAKVDHVDKDLIKHKIIETQPKKAALIEDYFASLPSPSSADNILRLYHEQYKGKLREELILALGSNKEDKVIRLFDEYINVKIEEQQEEVFHGASLEELSVHFDRKNLIPIYPTILNEALGGGVPRQTQLCIFARPDVGKSTVAINLAVGAAEAGFRVLYVGNEDPASVMVARILTRFTRRPVRELWLDREGAYKVALERGYKNLYFVSAHPGTPSEIRQYVEKIRPDMVVIDQIRNCHFKPDSMTVNLEQGVIFTRNLGKEFNLVPVVVTQAGNSAAGKTVLTMEDVEWSNCLAKGTNILMYSGEIRPIEALARGDKVMGMDSTPRTVLATGNGRQRMYRISHKNGDSYIVNENHILTLKNTDKRIRYGVGPKQVVDISLKDILVNRNKLDYLKGLHVGVEYDTKWDLPIHPYLFGLWLADGFSHTFSISSSDKEMVDITARYCNDTQQIRVVNDNNYIIGFGQQGNGHRNKWNSILRKLKVWKNKHIPYMYRVGKREDRLQVLAGIIDGDGTMRGGGKHAHTFTVYSGTETFAKQVKCLAQSVGLYAAYHKVSDTEYTVNISGKVSEIPTNLERKKATNDSRIEWLCSGIEVEELQEDEYYGITVDGDNRFILGDSYIVTHNTGVAAQMDLMVGVGQNDQMKDARTVMLSFPKNKLTAPLKPILCNIEYELNRLTVST